VIRIKNTQELGTLYISEVLVEELTGNPELRGRLEILEDPREMQFDVMGYLAR
jgi:hypothetical protein